MLLNMPFLKKPCSHDSVSYQNYFLKTSGLVLFSTLLVKGEELSYAEWERVVLTQFCDTEPHENVLQRPFVKLCDVIRAVTSRRPRRRGQCIPWCL